MKNLINFLSKRWKYLLLIALLIAIVLGMRSCSQGNSAAKFYTIARSTSWPLLEQIGKEKNMQGFMDELLLEIAHQEEIKLQIFNTNRDQLLIGLNDALYDGALIILTPDVMLEAHYAISEPFFLTGPLLIVRAGSNIKSFKEIQGHRIGMIQGISSFTMQQLASYEINYYNSFTLAFNDLERMNIEGFIVDAITAYAYISGPYAGKIKIITPPLTKEGLSLVALHSERSKTLIQKLDNGLNELLKNGTYDKLILKWGLFNTLSESQ